MQIGQTVKLFDREKGANEEAVIDAIVGAGVSGAKLLNLTVGNDKHTSVMHFNDANDFDLFWTLATVADPKNWKREPEMAGEKVAKRLFGKK